MEKNNNLIAWYPFSDEMHPGRDASGQGRDALPKGAAAPSIKEVGGRKAAAFAGGPCGTSYFELPKDVLEGVSDRSGFTAAAWLYLEKGSSVWERIFDFGKGQEGPYFFLTRNLRGDCFHNGDIVADPGRGCPVGEWLHIALSVQGTEGGTKSLCGPVIYVNGEVAADGSISQTSSGTYKKFRQWFDTFEEKECYVKNYIGRSQYAADDDLEGAMCDFRLYKESLNQDAVIALMCQALSEEEILVLARDKYLSFHSQIVTGDITLPASLMGGRVTVTWSSDREEILSGTGKVINPEGPVGITMKADLAIGEKHLGKTYSCTVMPKNVPPYEITIDGKEQVLPISRHLFGLFYEDINNAADGGIYAELVYNRSFESFVFDTYDARSGENGISTGRKRNPLDGWYGSLNKIQVENQGGLNEYLGMKDTDRNNYYITAKDGAVLTNRGFSDSNQSLSMYIRKGESYDFTLWAKSDAGGQIMAVLEDEEGNPVSSSAAAVIEGEHTWKKYGLDEAEKTNGVYKKYAAAGGKLILTGERDTRAQLTLRFEGEVSVDMVSLMPENVWGAEEESGSGTAHKNYTHNPNYRLRRDLVESLKELHPAFLRFPGGCISEGSYIWENVYDWKDSVDLVEKRKENFNVWGYMMTMGLGYMEYFQLAEDLGAAPLPVMACGVLCQARSDYANPAGGALQKKYIDNFTDLIDFAISTDTEGNPWAALRKSMGHEKPFDLHLLGVGNENWGMEFFASFEIFKAKIQAYMEKHYPGYDLTIISTAGAQADDDAYQQGWKFLSGHMEGGANVRFTDGETSWEEEVAWYQHQKNYMDTIVDEHYYRSNEYLLQNADRYNYYYRAYQPDGTLDENETSKVFVGEYASTDKNTLAGAVAEAAVMTGFERNSDVVRLAATAPLFNKVLTDGTYRWTPDAIWFDDETVWRTPNYYVQQLFAKYIGTGLLKTSFATYRDGKKETRKPHGGIELAAGNADILLKQVKVISNLDGAVLLEQDFRNPLDSRWCMGEGTKIEPAEEGLILKAGSENMPGLYVLDDTWTDYQVVVTAEKRCGKDGFYIGAGVTAPGPERKNAIVYAIGHGSAFTGVKVYKDGVEGYTMGDYSSSVMAGNLRDSAYEPLSEDTEYQITVNYGCGGREQLRCSYTDGQKESMVLEYKLEAYNREIFHSVTADEKHIYAKLVNADSAEKQVSIRLTGVQTAPAGKLVVLTGEEALLCVPNVNQKNDEKITPQEGSFSVENGETTVFLPGNSVSVFVYQKIR